VLRYIIKCTCFCLLTCLCFPFRRYKKKAGRR